MSDNSKAVEKAVENAVEESTPKKESTRRQFRNDAWTEELVAEQYKKLQVTEIPVTEDKRPWVQLTELDDTCKIHGVSISKMVKAIGGDRGMNPPLDPLFQVVYLGKRRFVHPDTMTLGLEKLKDPNFAATARKPRESKPVDPNAPVKEKKARAPKGAKVARPPAGEAPSAPAPLVWGEEQA